MIEVFAILCGLISGICLMAIALRKKLPVFGAILSSKLREELDSTDKRLALVALVFFLFFIIFIILSNKLGSVTAITD